MYHDSSASYSRQSCLPPVRRSPINLPDSRACRPPSRKSPRTPSGIWSRWTRPSRLKPSPGRCWRRAAIWRSARASRLQPCSSSCRNRRRVRSRRPSCNCCRLICCWPRGTPIRRWSCWKASRMSRWMPIPRRTGIASGSCCNWTSTTSLVPPSLSFCWSPTWPRASWPPTTSRSGRCWKAWPPPPCRRWKRPRPPTWLQAGCDWRP